MLKMPVIFWMKWGYRMKTLGIIGGIAPESTMQYYKFIIESYRSTKQDGNYPPILINSINMKKMLDLIGEGELTKVTDYLVHEIRKLAIGGAEFALLASNTPHIVFDEIREQSPIPLISIVEAASEAVKATGMDKVGLMGTRFTMQADFYPEIFSREDITIAIPELEDQEYIHTKYMTELVNNIILDETLQGFLDIIEKMKVKDNIQGLILGGTELPLILKETTTGFPLFNTTKIHVEAAVAEMLT
jgi:aspartate racemase